MTMRDPAVEAAPRGAGPHLRRNLLFAVSLLALFTACSPSGKESAPLDLSLHFTCDTHGRLVPCGCFTGQFGGLTRLKTALDGGSQTNELRLDVGDAIGGKEDFHLIEYRKILDAYALMRFDAMNIGQREARLPLAELLKLKQSSPVPILSANLLDKATGKPVFETHRLVRRGAKTIAIVGLLDPRGLGEDLGAGLVVETMEAVLPRVLPGLRATADLVIVLAFTDEATLTRLAQEFYEIDVLLGGKVAQPSQKLARENRSLIYFVTNESRALGWLRLRLSGRGRVEALADDVVLLHDRIPQSREIESMAAAYRQQVRAMKLAVDSPETLRDDAVPGVRTANTYAGSGACFECHADETAVWKHSGHARAFATLARRQAEADPKCIECHTVGFGTVSGYRRTFGGSKLADVGCESCHGPGSLHVRQQNGDKTVNFRFRPLGAGDCLKCHHGEFSRPFDWEKFWPPVAHGAKRQATNTTAAMPADPSTFVRLAQP